MIFPFSVRFNESLKINITSDNQKYILEYIKQSILDGKADNVNIGDMQVTYKGSTSPWRGSLYGGVDNGVRHGGVAAEIAEGIDVIG